MSIKILQLSLLSFLLYGSLIHADQVKIPIGSQSAELNNIARPTMGMSKNRVQQEFGEPIKVTAAKGKPPISSWEYANFVVYFENDHVIHSVLKTIYHESTEIVIKETVIEEPAVAVPAKSEASKMPEEDLDLSKK